MDEDLKAELTCPICMDMFSEPRRLPCGHVYCRTCLQDMLMRKYLHTRSSERILSCPECRQRYDLTFQEAGVNCFPRDFKLVRLVELYEKRFAGSSDAENGAGDKGDDEQTAVKTVSASDGAPENSPAVEASIYPPSGARQLSREVSPAVESASHHPSALRQLSREQLEADLRSFGSGPDTLSDDSWIYVSGAGEHSHRSVRPVPDAHQRDREDDSWLIPSAHPADTRFPVERGQDIRGSVVAGIDSGHFDNHSLNLSGSYENRGHETFQRYSLPQLVVDTQATGAVARRPASTSESSSETGSSDERGDEGDGSRSEDDASGSDSEASSQQQNRRSRLTRFFRSLVLSDSDSYDDDDDQGSDVDGGRLPSHTNVPQPRGLSHTDLCDHHREFIPQANLPHLGGSHHRLQISSQQLVFGDLSMSSSIQTPCPPPANLPTMNLSTGLPVLSSVELADQQGATTISFGAEVHSLPHSMPGHNGDGDAAQHHMFELGTSRSVACDQWATDLNVFSSINHASQERGNDDITGNGGASTLTSLSNNGVMPSGSRTSVSRNNITAEVSSRGRQVTEADSDDSGENYEAQTSMLRPRRKPRSRLKKFFTSLLSLSSSDEDEDEPASQTSAAQNT